MPRCIVQDKLQERHQTFKRNSMNVLFRLHGVNFVDFLRLDWELSFGKFIILFFSSTV